MEHSPPATARLAPDEYLARVRRAGLALDSQLEPFYKQLASEPAGSSDQDQKARIEALGSELEKSGLLSAWQHSMLVAGRGDQLTLGRYRLIRELAPGGMAKVYLAEHIQMRRRVAVKVFSNLPDIKDVRLQRFLVESRAAASLDHPHVARTFHFDWEGDLYYLVMEFVEGDDLNQLIAKHGPLESSTAAEYIRQAASALSHAHSRGLIHRDVKPSNLIVSQQGILKLLDLGLARFTSPAEPALTNDQSFLGTVDYVAPEQIVNSHAVDVRADVYSLGCTLYFLLAGQAPFAEYKLLERLHRHLTLAPRDLRSIRPDVSPQLAEICKAMMAKNPSDRPATAAEVERQLAGWLAGQSEGEGTIAFDVSTSQAVSSNSDQPWLSTRGKEAERVESALASLAGGIAHRVNNMLQCISGSVSLTAEEIGPMSPARSHLQSIDAIVESAASLMQDLQIFAGRNPALAVPCRLDVAVQEVLKEYELRDPSVTFHRFLESSLPPVAGNPAQIKTVCENVIANAYESLEGRPGEITLRLSLKKGEGTSGARLALECEDKGCGMHNETRVRACEPFFSTKSPDRGLGLAVAQGIVRSFGGELSLESVLGRGTTVRIEFPTVKEADRPAKTRGVVLVTDDERPVRELLAAMLKSAGYTVVLAKDGTEAIEIFRADPFKFDLVIFDLWMPRLGGEQLFDELRNIRPDVKAMLSSGSSDRDAIERMTRAGLLGVLQKPYQVQALLQKIADVLRPK